MLGFKTSDLTGNYS